MWLQTLLLATPATQGAALPLRAASETGEGTFAEDFPALPARAAPETQLAPGSKLLALPSTTPGCRSLLQASLSPPPGWLGRNKIHTCSFLFL